MPQHSKHYQTFSNRSLHLNADLEMVDIIDLSINAGLLSDGQEKLFIKLSQEKHLVLSKRDSTKNNRKLAINHLRQSVFSAYIKELYEEVYSYLKSVLTEAAVRAKVDPERLIGEHHVDIKIADVLSADKLQNVIQDIVAKIFRKLENERSTTALIEKTCDKLGLKVAKELQKSAIYYLEIRHQLVHADGKADAEFKKTHPDLNYTRGDYVDLRYKLIVDVRTAVFAFINEFDRLAIENGFVLPHT